MTTSNTAPPPVRSLSILDPKDRRRAAAFAAFLGLFFAGGFLPTVRQFFLYAEPYLGGLSPEGRRLVEILFFPALAALFHFSISKPGLGVSNQTAEPMLGVGSVFRLSVVPFTIALIFGAAHPGPTLLESWPTAEGKLAALWYLAAIPMGEELIFRGWLYEVSERLYPRKFATATNPLPVAVWVGAIAFSAWHVQNFGTEPAGWVAFQCLYTMFTGLWLGYLRWRTGGIAAPLFAHAALNLAASLF